MKFLESLFDSINIYFFIFFFFVCFFVCFLGFFPFFFVSHRITPGLVEKKVLTEKKEVSFAELWFTFMHAHEPAANTPKPVKSVVASLTAQICAD